MTPGQIHRLKQPAKNRGIKFEDLKNGKILLNGKLFVSSYEAEDYLVEIKRIDI